MGEQLDWGVVGQLSRAGLHRPEVVVMHVGQVDADVRGVVERKGYPGVYAEGCLWRNGCAHTESQCGAQSIRRHLLTRKIERVERRKVDIDVGRRGRSLTNEE